MIVVTMREIHESLLRSDSLRPEDGDMLRAIFMLAEVQDHVRCATAIREYYRDADRSDRTPRSLLYLHLGWMIGALTGPQ